jgi:4-amino-4-deoxy-L-arabinose transferase-like glycosyltransferase
MVGVAGRRAGLTLLAAWLVVAAFNVTKAVHVDDTAYLEMARQIRKEPLHPMSGLLNWDQTATPLHEQNQPQLLMYVMAAVTAVVPGHAQLALHLVWVGFSAIAVVLFYALARALTVRRPVSWTLLFCLGPAFVASQNLMMDVPLVATWLAFFLMVVRAFACPEERERKRWLLLAGVALSAACLIKYTSVALLPIFAVVIVARSGWRALWLLLVPLGALAAWSIFNVLDYGAVHILSRHISAAASPGLLKRLGVIVSRVGLWLIAVGAMSPYAPALIPFGRDRGGRWLTGLVALALLVTAVVGRVGLGREPAVQSVLRALFVANGVLVVGLAVRALRDGAGPGTTDAAADRSLRWLLGAWAAGAALFVIVLSPMIAVRHAMVALPALMLAIARGADAARLSRRALGAALAVSTLIGLAVAASDASLAEVYRRQAPAIAAQHCQGRRCVALGHWGWQWYATEAGMEVYDAERTMLAPGDRVIVPELVGKQTIRPEQMARLRQIDEIVVPSSPLTWVRTIATEHSSAQGDRAGGFYYFWTSVPWTLTTRPLDRFRIYEMLGPSPGH